VRESLKGQLLVAGADLLDPNFRRTVVLVTEHDEEGAVGLVLNRPAETTVVEAVPGLSALVDADAPVFVGGPVDQQSLLVLAEFHDPDDSASTIFDDVGFVRGDADISLAAGLTRRARVFAGYAGWSAGQLRSEIEEGAWFVLPGEPHDVFIDDPERLWRAVLRRQGGELAIVATFPDDPSLN
jgi:putative transcriptional regulator